ncbi:serine/threonine protein kinase, partial [Leptolyngbya sp. FACHB-36]|uniref:protein kinase domain-containing protein n=1 Tax=Leptolyngbya sp. FACHB-36 TaxID=2692808 RepID=UPI001680BDE5|nr:serine/threonine protein kinase [Leptolyngbya sp. FACHB-36]
MSQPLVKELWRSNYRVLGLVGQGQFGRVFCASHRRTGRLVALKELDRQRFPTHQFLRELRFLLSLQHPNIVNCQAMEHTPTGRYLILDYCEGGTLRNLMNDEMRLHPAQCLKLVMDVLLGLDHAHSRGIVHCDVKPENVLLTLQSDGWRAHISDFGIAQLSQDFDQRSGSNTGSPAYMAPERFYGQYSYSSDLYAVGILLFELLQGHRPFAGTPIELMSAHLNQPISLPETIPLPLQAILVTALQKLPARRFRSAIEMQTAVQAVSEALYPSTGVEIEALLQPVAALPSCPFHSVHQENLDAAIQQLVVTSCSPMSQSISSTIAGDCVYSSASRCLTAQVYPQGLLNNESSAVAPASTSRLCLPESIQELIARPQGCFMLTQHSIHCATIEGTTIGTPSTLNHSVKLIATFRRSFIAAIETQGRWMAAMALEPDDNRRTLSIWRLGRQQSTAVTVHLPASHVFQLLALDSRYIAAFSHTVNQHARISGVFLELFTRRGNAVGSLNLPTP